MVSAEEAVAALRIPARRLELYTMALRHRSVCGAPGMNNERLEFLGDSVIGTAVTSYLYRRYPGVSEGFLTRVRTHLVMGSTQTEVARAIGMGGLVEVADGGGVSGSVLEDAFEAVAGAVFLDLGFDEAERWIISAYERAVDFAEVADSHVTNKERLMEIASRRGESLSFDASRVVGGRHKVVVSARSALSGPLLIGVGEGDSKRQASEEACARGVQHYGMGGRRAQRAEAPG